MQKMLIAFLFCCLAFSTLARGQTNVHPTLAPKLVCAEPIYEFGQMDNNLTVEHTFIIQNTGNLSLIISQVRTSCGCTAVNISNSTLRPGETAQIMAKLSLHGRRGPQNKAITVESNDPKKPKITLYLRGTAIPALQVTPELIFYGNIASNAVISRPVYLVTKDNQFNILSAKANVSWLDLRTETIEAGKNYILHITTKPPLPAGELKGMVTVTTDNPKWPEVKITVLGAVTKEGRN